MNKFRKSLPPLASLLPFEAAARLGSITRAGEELGLTQAAVSRQIKSLEENLGLPLFKRRNRAIHLTADGRELEGAVRDALETLSTGATRLRNRGSSGEVILFTQLCEGLYWVTPHLSKFYQQHPNIEVRIQVSVKPLTDTVEYFDLAMQTSGRNSGDCERVFSVPDAVYPVCSPQYYDTAQGLLSLADIGTHQLLHHRVFPQDWMNWDDWLARSGSAMRVGYEGTVYDSYPMMIQAAIEGHGIALGWDTTMDQLLNTGALLRPCAPQLSVADELSVYRHPQCRDRPEIAIFTDWLQGELTSNA